MKAIDLSNKNGGYTFIESRAIHIHSGPDRQDKIGYLLGNPGIAGHGGFVSLIDIKGNDVIIQMGGGCQGCGMANVTLKDGIEVALRNAIPEIGGIYDVTDHADGKNPYYK